MIDVDFAGIASALWHYHINDGG